MRQGRVLVLFHTTSRSLASLSAITYIINEHQRIPKRYTDGAGEYGGFPPLDGSAVSTRQTPKRQLESSGTARTAPWAAIGEQLDRRETSQSGTSRILHRFVQCAVNQQMSTQLPAANYSTTFKHHS
jgi:hypothetical protein